MKLFPKNFEILNRKAKQYIMPILTPHLLKLRINTYAPYVGAGIKLEHLDTDQGLCVVSMGLTALNKNIVGTQFGGSLYAMTDPFYMLLLMQQLGSNYVVWDKSSHIEFVAPATSKVTARIKVSSSEATAIRKLAESGVRFVQLMHSGWDQHQNLPTQEPWWGWGVRWRRRSQSAVPPPSSLQVGAKVMGSTSWEPGVRDCGRSRSPASW